jgi:hypothetical protein
MAGDVSGLFIEARDRLKETLAQPGLGRSEEIRRLDTHSHPTRPRQHPTACDLKSSLCSSTPKRLGESDEELEASRYGLLDETKNIGENVNLAVRWRLETPLIPEEASGHPNSCGHVFSGLPMALGEEHREARNLESSLLCHQP